jgi:ribosome-binding protein aMBF1 (putative translation factor)
VSKRSSEMNILVSVEVKKAFAVRFKKCLQESMLSNQSLAVKLDTSREVVRRYSAGNAYPHKMRMKQIAAIFKVRLRWLESGEGAKRLKDPISSPLTAPMAPLETELFTALLSQARALPKRNEVSHR